MASSSFVEQATLLVKDGSTAPIKKINAALRELFQTRLSSKRRGRRINSVPQQLDRRYDR